MVARQTALLLLTVLCAGDAFISSPGSGLLRRHGATRARRGDGRTEGARPRVFSEVLGRGGLSRQQERVPRGPLPHTAIVLRHKTTGTLCYLQGVIHGAKASAEDVTSLITGEDPNVVVLELCESRYKVLQSEREKMRETGQDADEKDPIKRLSKIADTLGEFRRSYGILQTILVTLLSSSAEMQRMITRDKSCEFHTSVELAEARNAKVVLGDQDLGITMRRFQQGWDWSSFTTLPSDLASIRDAIIGPQGLPSAFKVNVAGVLFTQARYIRELLIITVPVSVVVLASLEGIKALTGGTFDAAMAFVPVSAADAAALDAVPSMAEMAVTLAYSAVHLFMLNYLFSLNRFVLVERDRFLARSIADACASNPGARVAAVLGLLHCNGVARHLRDMGFELVPAPRT